VRLIRSEILGGGQAPAEIARFIPKWKYLFGPNANTVANNATDADPNNIRYKYNTKEGGEEATKRLIEEIEQLIRRLRWVSWQNQSARICSNGASI
jgi:hypothetical protein